MEERGKTKQAWVIFLNASAHRHVLRAHVGGVSHVQVGKRNRIDRRPRVIARYVVSCQALLTVTLRGVLLGLAHRDVAVHTPHIAGKRAAKQKTNLGGCFKTFRQLIDAC